MSWTLHEGDCLDIMRSLPDASVDAVITDPPYNIGKASWDKIDDYLGFCEAWIAEASRMLKPQGAFWCFHSEPLVLADISRIIERNGRPMVNWITWDKDAWTYCRKYSDAGSRRFIDSCEYLVYHADESDWLVARDETREAAFAPLIEYLRSERERRGLTNGEIDTICGWRTKAFHFFAESGSNFSLPNETSYAEMRAAFGEGYFQRPWGQLKEEYDAAWKSATPNLTPKRPSFHNPEQLGVVWAMPSAPANGHPTPKPVSIMERIVAATTNEGDTILDPFAGSGSTLLAAESLGRNSVGIEREPRYCDIIRRRMSAIQGVLL